MDERGRPRAGPAVSLDDIKRFRTLDSVCAGHPEFRLTAGVETTTGPLGQGAANSVGMAMAERWLAARYNRPGITVFDHNVYALCSDGDLMEGVTGEAASIAGHLRLSNLCWIYDDNGVTIEGSTELAFSEAVGQRFAGYGWAVLEVPDANDCEALSEAVDCFLSTADRPTLIRVRSVIGYGAPNKQGTAKAHSDPLGAAEARLAKRAYGWPEDARFKVPEGVRSHFAATLGARGQAASSAWAKTLESLATAHPDLAQELRLLLAGQPPEGWGRDIPTFEPTGKGLATRDASGKVLNAIGARLPWLVGGSADLAPSTKTRLEFPGAGDFEWNTYAGRNLHFGVREHAMAAIANGLALSGLRPFVGTFLIFSDYMRPPTRLAAMMRLPVVFAFSHDSIGVGQDGSTHQPVEQLAALRAIPGLLVVRPADANETAEAWRTILARAGGPACLVLSRQALPTLDRSKYAPATGLARGAYILADTEGEPPAVILIATGSEVAACLETHERLALEGVRSRVVSMPSWELVEQQDADYRGSVLPQSVTARVTVEAASPLGWDRYAGADGEILAMRTFGASAPFEALKLKFGFTADHIYQAARRQLAAAAGLRHDKADT
ncbi:transketolase [uncultured Phenylobacterium sp.]|uniref:transketolase family protein n=1 Tax=uncultured Phenylobacterium sp. TaxID=349273 RepID=UPI0025CF755C|nr:transketolase [uncultured Phenylobacterium sp.]